MGLAGAESVLVARLRQNVLALNRAEFRLAADPTGQNLSEVKSIIEAQREELNERLTELEATDGEQQAKLLAKVRAASETYFGELADTLRVADRVSSQVSVTGAQKEVIDMAMASGTRPGEQ